MIRLYGVLDADGFKINTITAESDQVDAGWYPGYGAALVDEGENPPDPPPFVSPPKPKDWLVLDALPEPMTVGDQINLATLIAEGDKIDPKTIIVTKAADLAVAVDPIDPVTEPPIQVGLQ